MSDPQWQEASIIFFLSFLTKISLSNQIPSSRVSLVNPSCCACIRGKVSQQSVCGMQPADNPWPGMKPLSPASEQYAGRPGSQACPLLPPLLDLQDFIFGLSRLVFPFLAIPPLQHFTLHFLRESAGVFAVFRFP